MVLSQLSINSLARLNYVSTSASNFRVDLSSPLIGKINSFSLKSATIPNTIYNIAAPINVLSYTSSTGPTSVTLPPGNYSVAEVVSALQTLMNGGADTYTVTYNAMTGKITFTSSFAGFTLLPGNTQVSDRGEIFSSPPSLNYQLGFLPLTTYPSTAGVLVAPNVPSLQGLEHVYIRVKQFKQFYKNTVNSHFTFDVPIYTGFTGINYYTEETGSIQNYVSANSSYLNTGFLEVELLNVFGTRINLNGSDWGFVMEFEMDDA